jgi:hypothetical protein
MEQEIKIEERHQSWKVIVEPGIRKWAGVTDQMEAQMTELGMKQWVTQKEEWVEPVEGVSRKEYHQGMGCWFNDRYEAKLMTNRYPYRLILIDMSKGEGLQSVVDDGKPYGWEDGIQRLKELINK